MLRDDDRPGGVYLAGAVDYDLTLGIKWRMEVAQVLEMVGMTPVYPAGLDPARFRCPDGSLSMAMLDRVRAEFDSNKRRVWLDNLERLLGADVVFVRETRDIGFGTIAEVALCRAVGVPMVRWDTYYETLEDALSRVERVLECVEAERVSRAAI